MNDEFSMPSLTALEHAQLGTLIEAVGDEFASCLLNGEFFLLKEIGNPRTKLNAAIAYDRLRQPLDDISFRFVQQAFTEALEPVDDFYQADRRQFTEICLDIMSDNDVMQARRLEAGLTVGEKLWATDKVCLDHLQANARPEADMPVRSIGEVQQAIADYRECRTMRFVQVGIDAPTIKTVRLEVIGDAYAALKQNYELAAPIHPRGVVVDIRSKQRREP